MVFYTMTGAMVGVTTRVVTKLPIKVADRLNGAHSSHSNTVLIGFHFETPIHTIIFPNYKIISKIIREYLNRTI